MVLEKTIFQVDVVQVTMRVDSSGADRLAPLAAEDEPSPALADSVAAIVLSTPDVDVDLRFVHGASQKQFLNGIRDNLKLLVKVGWMSEAQSESLQGKLAGWYAFLKDRGIRVGDTMLYRVRGDTIRYVYVGVGDEVLLDFVGNDPADRVSVLGSYLVPGSDFRNKLVESLLQPER